MPIKTRGQAYSICESILDDIIESITINKRDRKYTKPGSNVKDNIKEPTTVDIIPKGGDVAGDVVGERKAGYVEGETGCWSC